jgi:hypothetical protein
LKKDLQENTRRAGCILFSKADVFQNLPADGIGEQQVREQLAYVS